MQSSQIIVLEMPMEQPGESSDNMQDNSDQMLRKKGNACFLSDTGPSEADILRSNEDKHARIQRSQLINSVLFQNSTYA